MGKKNVMEVVLEDYDRAVRESYKAPEDSIDTVNASQTSKVRENVSDLLNGESKRGWVKEFGNC